MDEPDFRTEYQSEPPARDDLSLLAWQYHQICETNDRGICSKIVNGVAVPQSSGESVAINRYAKQTFDFLYRQALSLGHSREEFRRAISESARAYERHLRQSSPAKA